MSPRLSWLLAALILVASAALMALVGSDDSSARSPVPVPDTAESARLDALRAQFPGGERVPAIVVISRDDGTPLTRTDLDAVERKWPSVQVSEDGAAALAVVPLDADLTGFELNDAVKGVRASAAEGLPADLKSEVTGGPAFGADIANSFSGANITLLAVTAFVVALLLIATYRSPVLWLVPLAVIGFADRVAAVVGSAVAQAVGMHPDGSTSGITSVLVFGAGTNYALLLISRYREELGRNDNHRDALGVAVRRAGPAIVASNATVVLALLTLVFASSPSVRSLGVQAAAGLVVAALYVLLVLPPLLALFGRRLFWPFIPQVGTKPLTDSGIWHRIAESVARRPGRVAVVAVATRPAVHGCVHHAGRVVADRTVPGAGRIGQRLPDAVRPLPQRPDRPDPRHRGHRPGRSRAARDHRDAGRRVGQPGRAEPSRAHPVVGGTRRRTRLGAGIRNR
jgi:putative drug exporter of the RND superfamily